MMSNLRGYFSKIEHELDLFYNIAGQARSIGIDPALQPESHLAKDLGEMVEGLVGPAGIAKRIRELTLKNIERHEMALIIALDIILAKYGHTNSEEASEQSIKTSLAVMTGGITAAPIQGISKVKIKNNLDRTRYLAIYFAGPIRAAAGTEQALTLVIGDFIRRRLGLDRYKPTNNEINRFIEEIRLYEREVSRFQYHISDEELAFCLQNIPIEVTGTATDLIEVSSYRNLPRIETNYVRAGALRIVNDGVVGRSQKVLRIIEALEIDGWDWLKKLKETNRASDDGKSMYMEDIIAGRPVFAFPSRVGGFRLRYGRSRNTGLAALGIHPATMIILNNFLASGTQIRIEGPGKGGIVVPVDTIEPPFVRLKNGSAIRIETIAQASRLKNDIESILFLGDLLVAFGEFLENNKPLLKSGYVEEWWIQDVEGALYRVFGGSLSIAAKTLGIPLKRLKELVENPLRIKPTSKEALILATKLKLPLHPYFTYFWKNITFKELAILRRILIKNKLDNVNNSDYKVQLSFNRHLKDIFERLAVPHQIEENKILLGQDALVLNSCLNIYSPNTRIKKQKTIINTVQSLSGIWLREKAPTYIGARMGRPEKARKRTMSPPVHVLFPVGLAGGPRRDILMAAKKGSFRVDLVRRKCPKCDIITLSSKCPHCNSLTYIEQSCPRCGRVLNSDKCPICAVATKGFNNKLINFRKIYGDACSVVGFTPVEVTKGVRGLTSADKIPEPLEKGILRAKHGISVYKDGTVRFDVTNAPLTHFSPEEIGVSIKNLRSLNYDHDMFGDPLQSLGQVCELKVQDVIIPKNGAEYLLHVAQFIDELLESVYTLPTYYKAKQREDLLGHLIVGFAPHTSAGIIGRIIGFTNANVCYAHPLWHNTKRRDCDGDEDAIMLTLDVLLNFSKSYLPARIGGMMDAPILLISTINAFEVDEARNMDVASYYPLIFYEKTLKHTDPKVISNIIDIIEHRLGKQAQFEGYNFTHQTLNINEGNLNSSYMKLGAMRNKLFSQLQLADIIKAVDSKEVAKKVLTTHLFRDIAGNLKAFTKQKVRCKVCNAKYRRFPLSGKCSRCDNKLLLTVHRKGIEKYLDLSDELIQKYSLDKYYDQRIAIIRDEISSLFNQTTAKKDKAFGKQVKLGEFMSISPK